MNKIKCVLFDLDGVLLDAVDWHFEAFNESIQHFGISLDRTEHENVFNGLSTKQKLKILSDKGYIPSRLHSTINFMKQSFTKEKILLNCRPIFDQEYLLANLKQSNIILGVCTNSVRDTLNLALEKLQIEKFFDVTLSNEDVAKPKPDAEIYLKAMAMVGVDPHETLIIEDNPNGIKAATASGANVLKILNPRELTLRVLSDYLRENNLC